MMCVALGGIVKTDNPLMQKTRFVPITHSRAREIVDVIEKRLLTASRDKRVVEIDAEIGIGTGLGRITLVFGEKVGA